MILFIYLLTDDPFTEAEAEDEEVYDEEEEDEAGQDEEDYEEEQAADADDEKSPLTGRSKHKLHSAYRTYLEVHFVGTLFPGIIMRGRLFEGRRLFEGGDYFKYCSLVVMP